MIVSAFRALSQTAPGRVITAGGAGVRVVAGTAVETVAGAVIDCWCAC